jgi:hypothetical protein
MNSDKNMIVVKYGSLNKHYIQKKLMCNFTHWNYKLNHSKKW